MVAAWQLDYLVETDVVELASFLPVDLVDRRDKLAVVAPLAILLALYPSIVVFSLVCGFWLEPYPCICRRLHGRPPHRWLGLS